MLTGTFLESGITFLPGIIVLVPAILEMRGTISGSFSARISTALHIGTIKPQFTGNTKSFHQNIYANLFLTLLLPFVAAAISTLIMELFHVRYISFFSLLFIAFFAAVVSGLIQILVSITSGFLIFKKGLDPDLMVFPLLSVIGDILSIFCIMLFTNIFIGLMGWERMMIGWWGVFL